MKTVRLAISTLAAVILLGGCMATTSEPQADRKAVQAYLSDKPQETRGLFARVVAEGERNRVLNLMRAGLASMELGHNELAAKSFDEALLTIETVYAGDKKAERARSTFTAEDRKTFRGEPYERAMAFYYRGILYLMEGDYENARASFRSGGLQDTLAEQEKYRQDFALLEFLEGWASQCNGDTSLAAEAYALAKEHNPKVALPEADHNLLVLADLGHAPVKFAEGDYVELLKIKASGKSYNIDTTFRLNDLLATLPNQESVVWQAQTRGGREFDAILEGKAKFKEGAQQVAQAGAAVAQTGVGVGMAGLSSGNRDMAGVGAGMTAVGGFVTLISGAVAQATKPEADIRQWDNLPETAIYGTYRVEPDAAPAVIGQLPGTLRQGGDTRCRIAWTRHPATDMNDAHATVAGKAFSGTIDYGKDGIHPYKLSFSPGGEVVATWGSGFFSSGSLSGRWVAHGDVVQVKYSQSPNIDATNLLTIDGTALSGKHKNRNGFAGRVDHAIVRLQQEKKGA